MWKCRCECGKEKLVLATCLRSGNTKSCGCLQKEWCRKNAARANNAAVKARYLGKNVSLVNFQFRHYRIRAKQKGIEFNLSREEFEELIRSVCFYCGEEPKQRLALRRINNQDVLLRNGVDRIDPNVGYVKGNVVACCWRCNRAKGNDTRERFYEWATRLGERAKSNLWDIDAEDRLADMEVNCNMLGERFGREI
jgi:hypothetical protein